mmetsp:Transcript_24075/g.46638  ORF Transcript_24075/g.46638 Transcript_24075/m.46638 type:complete len:146 (+) Transcript_24075:51-488(+)
MLEAVDASLVYVPELRGHKPASKLTSAEKLASARHEFEIAMAHLARERKRVSKAEQKIGKLTMGYIKRAGNLAAEGAAMVDEAEATVVEQSTYALMCEYEAASLPRRLERLEKELEDEVKREKQLQKRYLDLTVRKQQLMGGAAK